MIERWNPRRGGVLVRNPHFRAWSPDRPDGFPDRITIRFQQQGAQIAAFKDGALDIARVRRLDPRGGSAQGALRRTAAHRPRARGPRMRSSTSSRRRLTTPASGARSTTPSIAADSPSSSGSETNKPTCQMPPPGLQGYTRSCRFTADPNPAGTWTSPNLARARRLVAASGTRGMKVEFWGARGFEAFGEPLPLGAAPARLSPQRAHVPRGRRDRGEVRRRAAAPPAARAVLMAREVARALQLPAGAGLVLGRRQLLALLRTANSTRAWSRPPARAARRRSSCGAASTPRSPQKRRPFLSSTGPRRP